MPRGDDKRQPVEVTREELYHQVWETPMSRLAERYGVTGNGLAKICDRLKIPYPPRGYWAKKAAGKNVVTYRLPAADETTPQHVTISPTPSPAKPPELAPEVQAQVETARTKAAAISVPARMTRPHAIIAGWLADHEHRKQEARRERDPWRKRIMDPGEFSASDQRQHRILDALLKELERQNGRAKEGERKDLYVEIQGERIDFQLREKQKQVRRPLTDEEKRWRFSSDRDWKQELQPTGKLVFAIKTYLSGGLRTEWLETDATPMEKLLPDIVAVFIAAGPLLVERRRQHEEQERQRRIAEQRRYEEQQHRQLERNRWRRFVEIAKEWRETRIAHEFLDALKATEIDLQQTIAGKSALEWIAWAEARLSNADQLSRGADGIFSEVAEVTSWTYPD